jgi:hypothetical protein
VVLHVVVGLVIEGGPGDEVISVIGEVLAVDEGVVNWELGHVVFSEGDQLVEVDVQTLGLVLLNDVGHVVGLGYLVDQPGT